MTTTSAAAIVTGASRGLGLGVARALTAAGHPVVLAARDGEAAASAARALQRDGAEALGMRADVTDPGDVGRLVAAAVGHFGGVAVLVNNAGAPPVLDPLDALDWNDMRRGIEVDVGGAFRVTQAAAPALRAHGGATVVNVAATAGGTVASPRHVGYSHSQAALLSLSRCLGAALAPDGVAVHCLCPALTTAGGVGRAAASVFAAGEGVGADEWIRRRLGAEPIGPDAVGAAVVDLLRRRASSVWNLDAHGLTEWAPTGPPDPERVAVAAPSSPEEAS